MKYSKIHRIQELHNKVIHASDHTRGYTDEEYLLEDKEIKKLTDATLGLVCTTCFGGKTNGPYKGPKRTAEQYALGYPTIHRIIDAGLAIK